MNFNNAKELFAKNNLTLSEKQFELFSVYSSFLVEYNNKINLTAITEENAIWEKHFLDSVLLFKHIKIDSGSKVIDVGTGAGFPGVAMAIYQNDLRLTLLDSLNKRIVFLQKLAEKTELNDCTCIHSRAEDAGHLVDYREKYDVACARAVAELPVLCEYCLPFVKTGGIFLALKGPNESADNAKSAIETLGGEFENSYIDELPDGSKRQLIVIRKIRETPDIYPRKAKAISNKHL